jgi:ABC-type sugar transport system permease subunit
VVIASVRNASTALIIRVVSYIPVVLPMAVAMRVWAFLYSSQIGYINHFLNDLLRFPIRPVWLGYDLALYSVAIASVWKDFGFNTLLFLVGIYGINPELYEAASIDGAGVWARFWNITIPGLKHIFVLIFVLGAGILSATEQMMLLTQGGPADSTLTTGLYLWRVAFAFGDMRLGYAASMSLLLGLVHTVMAVIIFKTLGTERS